MKKEKAGPSAGEGIGLLPLPRTRPVDKDGADNVRYTYLDGAGPGKRDFF